MNLRQKLYTTFGGLGLMILLLSGATIGSTIMWEKTTEKLEKHYQHSLLLIRITANVFRAVKKIPDAITIFDDDAEAEFMELMVPLTKDFKKWAFLVYSDEELDQVDVVRDAYKQVMIDAQQIFDLIRKQQISKAGRVLEDRLNDVSLHNFQTQIERAVASDRNFRKYVQAQVDWARRTDKTILAITAFGTISLMLLLFAYLANDLFSPLHQLKASLKAVAAGDYQQRIPVERKDELGEVQRAFNRMVASNAERQMLNSCAIAEDASSNPVPPFQELPSRITLHRLISRLKAQVRQASQRIREGTSDTTTEDLEGITVRLKHLLDTVVRFAEFGFPLDLNLSRFDVRTLLYEVLLRFHEPFAQRGVGFEIDLTADVKNVVADRLKLREVLSEIIRNALAALPTFGGHIGLHTSIGEDGSVLQIEVADDGCGTEPQIIDRALSLEYEDEDQSRPSTGLAFTRCIVEQHGGQVMVHTQPDEGTYVCLTLPL